MTLLNATFNRNALLCSLAAIVAAWVGENVIEPMKDMGPYYALAAFLIVHAWNMGLSLATRRLAGAVLVVVLSAAAANAQQFDYRSWQPPAGTVLVTLNLDSRLNRSPGTWNHSGKCVGLDVIEAQSGPPYAPPGGAVIRTPYLEFCDRPYRIVAFLNRDQLVGQRSAAIAATYVGRPYRRMSSLYPNLIPAIVPLLLHGRADGMNCVDVDREATEAVVGYPLVGYHTPDDTFWRGDIYFGPYLVK